jgi:glycerol-3-phosphate O-acyltransferase
MHFPGVTGDLCGSRVRGMEAQGGASTPGSRLILSAADTPVERELIERWAAEAGSASGEPSDVIELRGGQLAERLQAGDDPLLVPVRISWLPKERHGKREAGWRDLLALRDPRRPHRLAQSLIAGRDADRYRVVVGKPALASELRDRFIQRTDTAGRPAGSPAEPDAGAQPESAALAAFVVRQATLALERAERALIGDRYKVPRLVVEEIVTGARYRARLSELAARLQMPVGEVGARAAEALQELVAVQSRLAVDIFGTAMRPLHARAWQVRVEPAELERLRELNRHSALIFLPSHRSYADTLVLAEALHGHDFPRNHVVGGNNLALWPLAPLARRAGVVFIRRSFRDDEVYKLAIQEYFGYLVSKRFNLEWYFEGGRSRTGKLRPPRFGLLTYVAAALQADPAIDVHLVPVSITYEHLHEVSSMAAEQRGAAKQPEGLSWLARYVRDQRRAAGDAVVRFGPPVNMRSRLPEHPPAGPEDEAAQRLALNKLAFEVAVGINRATPVLPQSLLTLALLGVRDQALTLDQVSRLLAPVLDYIEARSLPQSGTSQLRQPWQLAAALHGLERAKVVTVYTGGDEPVYSITPGQHLVAAFYRNNSIHWFVNRAIVELAMIEVAEQAGDRPLATAWAEALELRDLLKHEFFFPEKEVFRGELLDELELIDPKWAERSGSVADVRALLAASGFLFAHRVLRSFVEAELVVAERLVVHPVNVPVDEKAFLADCAGSGQQMLLQGRVHSAEALSGELFGAALRLAEGRQLLAAGEGPEAGSDLAARRAEFAAQLRHVAERIRLAAEIDAQSSPVTAPG